MNPIHEANRRGWNAASRGWQAMIDTRGEWRLCHKQPELIFTREELSWLNDVRGRRAAVLGSGDNLAVFALAGMGADVTSVDISQEQLACATGRARELGLDIEFVHADVTDLGVLADGGFDIVFTGGHVAVWVSDLTKYYAEAGRILKPGGLFIVSEYHPFRRIASAQALGYELEKRYLNRGPFEYDRSDEVAERSQRTGVDAVETSPLPSFEFHWTVGDFINAMIASGCEIVECREYGEDVTKWEGLTTADILSTLLIVARKR